MPIRPKTARRERLWVEAVDLHYFTPQEVADAAGLSLRRVQYGLKRAREMAIDFQTVWDIEWRTSPNVFDPGMSNCEWHDRRDIPNGLAIGCLSCLRSGLESLIARSRPKSEPGKPSPSDQRKSFAERHHKPKATK